MALELRWPKSRQWYGRFEVKGQRHTIRLGVRVEGVPPPSLRLRGDAKFEISREKAQRAFDKFVADIKERGSNIRLLEKLIDLRSGDQTREVPITALFEEWRAIPRAKPVSPRHEQNVKAMFIRFAGFVSQVAPAANVASMVEARVAERFMESESKRGISAKTFNEVLGALRMTFEHLGTDALIAKNPFIRIHRRQVDTMSRIALLPAQVKQVLDVAEQHPFIRPLLIVGLCTAMRRSDCCHLLWEHINFERRTIRIKTRKTKETIEIPIFPMLERELLLQRSQLGDQKVTGFVFPELARMDEANPDGLTWRYEQLLKTAGFEITASDDAVRDVNATRQKRTGGLRAASVRGFHALRTTWVTFAMLVGVPTDVIRLVTGHRAVQVVENHYFKPNAAQYREVLENRLPGFLTGAEPRGPGKLNAPTGLLVWIKEKLELMTSETWLLRREEILAGIAAQNVVVPVETSNAISLEPC